MNATLFNESINKLRYYKNKNPNLNEIITTKISDYKESYITCYSFEYQKTFNLFYKEATNIKKFKNIKRYFNSLENTYLKVIQKDGDYIEMSHRIIEKDEIIDYEFFLKIYSILRKTFIKYFILANHDNDISLIEVENFLNDTLWTLDLNSKNISFHLSKFYVNNHYFTDSILYNWNNDIKNNIDTCLDNLIVKPKDKVMFVFTINSLELNAIQSIKNIILQFNKQYECHLKYYSTPDYQLLYEFSSENKENLNLMIHEKIKEFSEFTHCDKLTTIKFKSFNII